MLSSVCAHKYFFKRILFAYLYSISICLSVVFLSFIRFFFLFLSSTRRLEMHLCSALWNFRNSHRIELKVVVFVNLLLLLVRICWLNRLRQCRTRNTAEAERHEDKQKIRNSMNMMLLLMLFNCLLEQSELGIYGPHITITANNSDNKNGNMVD